MKKRLLRKRAAPVDRPDHLRSFVNVGGSEPDLDEMRETLAELRAGLFETSHAIERGARYLGLGVELDPDRGDAEHDRKRIVRYAKHAAIELAGQRRPGEREKKRASKQRNRARHREARVVAVVELAPQFDRAEWERIQAEEREREALRRTLFAEWQRAQRDREFARPLIDGAGLLLIKLRLAEQRFRERWNLEPATMIRLMWWTEGERR